MARILFVTVGTSAITNRELREKNGDLRDLPKELTSLPKDKDWGDLIRLAESTVLESLSYRSHVNWSKVEEKVREETAAYEAAITGLHRRFWDRSGVHHRLTHPKRTSAEAISTWLAGKANRMDGPGLQAGEDKVVLVCSRTCIGQMAGRINAAIFREFLFSGEGEREVVAEVVDDLRLEGIHDELNEGKPLSDQMREIYARHANSQCRLPLFNITGGFKGLIPAITVICFESNRTMLYMHEHMSGAVRLHFENGAVREEEFEPLHV